MIAALPQIPSYAQGLARHGGDSAYPELWDGPVARWVTALGPTGLTLPNFSPQGQAISGTLTNMDPGLDWVASEYGWTLNFPDRADHVVVPHIAALSPPQITVRVLFKTPTPLHWASIVISKGDSAIPAIDYDLYYSSTGYLYARFYSGGWRMHWIWSAVVADTWYDLAFSFGDGRARIWINGQLRLDEAEPNPMPQTSGELCLGNYSLYRNYSFLGQLALVEIWDRVLATSEVERLQGDPPAALQPRGRVLRMLPATGGPYRVVTGQTFQAAAVAGKMFHTGAAEGELFSTGSVIGECHGRSG